MKRVFSIILVIVLLVSCAMALELPCTGTANSKGVNVRQKATSSSKKIAQLDKGTVVTVLEEIEKGDDIWYKIETPKGKTGYILSDYLSVPDMERIQAAQESELATTMKITVQASCSDYNGVGKNWTQYYEINGIQVEDNEAEHILAPDQSFTVYTRVREQDNSPDTSTDTVIYTPTATEIEEGFTITQSIRVTENKGKNKGNAAVWKVTFRFVPKD